MEPRSTAVRPLAPQEGIDGLDPRTRAAVLGDGLRAFAVLDGSATPNLVTMLEAYDVSAACLYRGRLRNEDEAAAPWLVALEDGPFLRMLLTEGDPPTGLWSALGLVLHADADLADLAAHLRRFTAAPKPPTGDPILVRFWERDIVPDYFREERSDGPAMQLFSMRDGRAVRWTFLRGRTAEAFASDSATPPSRGPAFDLHRLARLTAHRRIAALCGAHGVTVEWPLFDGTDFLALRPAELDLIALYVSYFRVPMRIDPANAPDALAVHDLMLRTKFHIAQGLDLDGRPA